MPPSPAGYVWLVDVDLDMLFSLSLVEISKERCGAGKKKQPPERAMSVD